MLPSLAGEVQGAFAQQQLIIHNILLCLELLIDYSKKYIFPLSTFKIDIHKAYDSVEWEFIERVMLAFGFPNQFV